MMAEYSTRFSKHSNPQKGESCDSLLDLGATGMYNSVCFSSPVYAANDVLYLHPSLFPWPPSPPPEMRLTSFRSALARHPVKVMDEKRSEKGMGGSSALNCMFAVWQPDISNAWKTK